MDRPAQPRRFSPLASATLLALVATLPNLNSFGAFFVGDDFDFLVRMRQLRGALDTLYISYWGEWEPLWYLGFYRDWTLWGFEPAGYHAASLFWLVLGVVALFGLMVELWPESQIAPWAAALLFATHPLHDEAVTYLAARGHPMSTALALLALWAWFRRRRARSALRRRLVWVGGALVAALAAALAKETALMIPIWAALLEWCVERRMGWRRADLGRALRAFAVFMVPVASYLALRGLAVGLGSDKLRGDGLTDALSMAFQRIPQYALAGGLPLPFAFVDQPVIEALAPLGWAVVVAALLPGVVAVGRAWRAGRGVSRPVAIYVAGLAIVLVALLPVFWAELGLRRRYFFMPSVGYALAAGVALDALARRGRRTAWALLLLLTLAGGVGLFERNRLYLRAGEVTRDFVRTVGVAELSVERRRASARRRRVALVTLPRYLGGDGFSGAYVLHSSDARSALLLAGDWPERFFYVLKSYFSEQYQAELEFDAGGAAELVVSFGSAAAYRAARDRELDDAGGLTAVLGETDEIGRRLRYKLLLPSGFLAARGNELYLFSDERFRRVEQ